MDYRSGGGSGCILKNFNFRLAFAACVRYNHSTKGKGMANFKTKEIDSSGRLVAGTYQADSIEAVRGMVRDKGNSPVKVEEVAEAKSMEIVLFAAKPKPKALAMFCKQMHTMLHAGMPLLTSLDVLGAQVTDKKFASVIKDMSLRVQKGDSLSDAMKAQGSYFPSILVSMVTSGELTGNLDGVMDRMSNHFTKENKINSKVKAASTYPVILGAVALAAVVYLLTNVIPTFVGIFESSGAELPGITKFVINLSSSIAEKWYIYLGVVTAIVVGYKAFVGTKGGRLAVDKLKLSIPAIKGPLTQIITSRFTRTLSTLLSAGIPLLTCIETAGSVSGNKYVQQKLEEVGEDIRKGVQLAPLLGKTEVFPPMMVSMVGIGEESGALEELLEKTADYYDSEVDDAITQLMGVLEPVLILVVGGMVGVIIIAMLLPMMTLINTVQG